MNGSLPDSALVKQRREQMLKLVAKGFYNELIKYGVEKGEVIKVASHLLDNLLVVSDRPGPAVRSYNQMFTVGAVKDEWQERRQLAVHDVSLRPLEASLLPKVAEWLSNPVVRESFVPAYPGTETALHDYLFQPGRDYFAIFYQERPVGIVGGENVDQQAGKLEMKKLVGQSGLQGKGIGKRATFGFLYYAFMILGLNKVYIHSRDINIRNINLNSGFGFELEGIFFEDVKVGDRRQDIVRMALFKTLWLELFAPA